MAFSLISGQHSWDPKERKAAVSETALTFGRREHLQGLPWAVGTILTRTPGDTPTPISSVCSGEHSCPFKTALWPQAPPEALPAWKPLIKVQRDVKKQAARDRPCLGGCSGERALGRLGVSSRGKGWKGSMPLGFCNLKTGIAWPGMEQSWLITEQSFTLMSPARAPHVSQFLWTPPPLGSALQEPTSAYQNLVYLWTASGLALPSSSMVERSAAMVQWLFAQQLPHPLGPFPAHRYTPSTK